MGEHDVTYLVTDLGGLGSTLEARWVIVDVNDAPEILSQVPSLIQAEEDLPFNLVLSAYDIDGDIVQWSDDTELFEVSPSKGVISFTPRQSDIGTYPVKVFAFDDRGGRTEIGFVLEIVGVNDAPEILSVTPESGSKYRKDTEVPFRAEAVDEDGDALTFTWGTKGKVLGTGAELVHSGLSVGTHNITLEVSDGNATTEAHILLVIEEATVAGAASWVIAGLVAVILVLVVAVMVMAHRMKGLRQALDGEGQGPEAASEEGSSEEAEASLEDDEQ